MAAVVVAEDNVEHQHLIAEVVRRLGHDPIVADDGREALTAVAEHRPDLVIADVDMPRLDGLQMCRAMHEDPGLRAVPVILVTAYLPPSDPEMTSAGVAAVVRKPFSIKELTDAVRLQLDCRPAADPAPGDAGDDLNRHAATGDPAFVTALLHSLDTGVVACDVDGRLVVFNRALREFFGAGGERVPLQEWPRRFRLHHHDGTPMRPEELPLTRALAGEHVRHAGMMAYGRHDRPCWFLINAGPICDASGTTLGAVAAVHDITGSYQAERYRDCKTEVLKVLAHAPDTVTAARRTLQAIATSLDWPYLRLWLIDTVTERLRPVATYTAPGRTPVPIPDSVQIGHGLAGQCWQRRELVWVPDIRSPASPVLPEVRAGSTYRAAGAVPVTSGETVIGVLTFFSHSPQEPEPALAVLLSGIAGNIGAYLERRRAEELALRLAATTDEYIALVGHELRTPLTSIGSYTDLIAESPDATPVGEVRGLLEVIARNNARLRTLVEELLDLAALESGHTGLTRAPVDLAAVVADAVAAIEPTAREHRITVHTDLPGRLTVTGDPHRLHQVVDNLVGNAVKYSPEDSAVTVALSTADEAAVLTVADHGIGVPADEQQQLFRRLFRASNARHTGIPGTGLGLALCRVVVERHHGTLTMTPNQPSGTVVTVRLPQQAAG
jgi:PAS domain S-box-containing protein